MNWIPNFQKEQLLNGMLLRKILNSIERKKDYKGIYMVIDVPAEILLSMLFQEHEIEDAPRYREYVVNYKEINIPIGKDNYATLTIDEGSLKQLEKETGIEIKEEAYAS
jgi:hypothetical protein